MPSLADNLFLFVLALLLFGPKKLPQLAREVGKWVGEFRRASNDFRMQMEDELRVSEQQDKQQQIDKLIAENPAANPALIPEPEHPHDSPLSETTEPAPVAVETPADAFAAPVVASTESPEITSVPETATPTPIAQHAEITMMPPSTGLPIGRTSTQAQPATASDAEADSVSDLFGSLPTNDLPNTVANGETEAVSHG